jgi:dTDP-4-dehydrorhamnose reductase
MKPLPRILVLGANGQVGWELCRSLAVLGEVVPVSRNAVKTPYDLADLAGLPAFLDRLAPDVIVNAAAYTAVDKAESERDAAFTLNAGLPEVLGAWAGQRDVPVVHYSTDYVFDGTKDSPYVETDTPNPINVYGESKLAGDQALLASGAPVWVLRVSWVYGLRGGNFLLTMLRLMQERDSLNIVNDQHGAPTWCRNIADATGAMLSQVLADPDRRRDTVGVYHLPPAGETTWFGFAEAIRKQLDLECELAGIPTSDYPTPARRPLNSRMEGSHLRETFGIALPEWSAALTTCLADR